MKHIAVVSLLLLQVAMVNSLSAQDNNNNFKKAAFYSAMQDNKEDAINKQLDLLKTAGFAEKDAFEGALLMKKAGMVGGPKKKLDLFKAGHKKLEAVLEKDTSNTELRFLRLMIQENAPGILGYKKEIQKDKLFIKSNYRTLPAVVQAAVKDYSKTSKIITSSDF